MLGAWRRVPASTFQAALDAGAPVRPVTLGYVQGGAPTTVAAFVGDDTLPRSLARVSLARDLTLRVRAHPVLPPDGDRRALAERARHAVLGRRGTARQEAAGLRNHHSSGPAISQVTSTVVPTGSRVDVAVLPATRTRSGSPVAYSTRTS